jgi:hypothetical protein
MTNQLTSTPANLRRRFHAEPRRRGELLSESKPRCRAPLLSIHDPKELLGVGSDASRRHRGVSVLSAPPRLRVSLVRAAA